MRKRSFGLLATSAVAFSLAWLSATPEAHADTIIKRPNAHPVYRAELEPHATFIPWSPVNYRYGRRGNFSDWEVGAGFRATIEIVDPGFIPKLNNTVGITFGLDISGCTGRYCYNDTWFMRAPVGLQWNFWLFDRFNAFAEFGVQPRIHRFFDETYFDFFAQVGGRVMFNDKVSFTFRVGYPYITLGVSFFVGH